MKTRVSFAVLALACAGSACAHVTPLPPEPPDIQGTVWAIRGLFEGGGDVVVRTTPTAADAMPMPSRVQVRTGSRILVRRADGKVGGANFSKIQLGQHVSVWWDGEPERDEAGRTGRVRVLIIQGV